MVAYINPQQRKKEGSESERLRGERDQVKFIVCFSSLDFYIFSFYLEVPCN